MSDEKASALGPYDVDAKKGFFASFLVVCISLLILCIDLIVRGWWGGEAPGGFLGLLPPGVWGGMGVAYLSVIGFNLIRLIGDPRPKLQISGEGIINRTYSSSATIVPWDDVIEIRDTRSPAILEIVLRDPAEFRARQSPLTRFVMQLTKVLGFGPFPVHVWQLKAPRGEVAKRLEAAMSEAEMLALRDERLLEDRASAGDESP